MSALLLLTSALQPSAEVLPGLALLAHTVKIVPAQGSALLDAPGSDLILVDGRQDLAAARDLCRLIRTTGADAPVLLVVTEGGLAVVAHDWGMDDVVLHTCGPAELDARIRLAIGRSSAAAPDDPAAHVIHRGEVVVDDATYTTPPARPRSRPGSGSRSAGSSHSATPTTPTRTSSAPARSPSTTRPTPPSSGAVRWT